MICFPNAKINIGLYVTGVRTDGYHTIETIFYPVPLRDALEVVKSDKTAFSQTGTPLGITPEENLVMKAYNLMRRQYQIPPLSIFLKKLIPSGAGLGGGSADATFMLMLLREWCELPLTERDLYQITSTLGADCPFFINNKPVIATGAGNLFQPTDLSLKGYTICIIKPPFTIATKEAYSMIKPQKPTLSLDKLSAIPVCEWKHKLVNDFEKGIFQKYPLIEKIKEQLYSMGAAYASMTGSGSAVYGLFTQKNLPVISDFSTDTMSVVFSDCFVWTGTLE